MSQVDTVVDSVVDVENHQPTHIDTFPYNKLVIESKPKKNMIVRGVVICMAILIFGGAIATAIVVSSDNSSDQAPAPAPGPALIYKGAYIDEPPPFEPKAGFEAMWWDEFDGEEIDRTKWYIQPDIVDYYTGNRQIQHYIDSPSTIEVSNDTLHIIADNPGEVQYNETSSNYDQTYYTSARINTKTTGGHWYPGMEVNGTTWNTIRVEARLKAPRGPGVVGAFWMLPIDNSCFPEIDIFETPYCERASMGTWYVNKDVPRGISKHGTTITESYDKFCDEYVTYAVEWNADYIAFYAGDAETPVFVTGKEIWAGKCDANDTDAPYNRPFYIILNTSIGSAWGGIPLNDIFPAVLDVDYVRVSGIRD